MKPAPFRYYAPGELDEAVELVAEHGDDGRILAGGQSLLPMLNLRLVQPSVLIDVTRIDSLQHVETVDDTLVVGAATRQRDVELFPALAGDWPLVAEAVRLVGHEAIRNRATVGGSLAHADPTAEWPALFLTLDGECDVVGPTGRRTIRARDFFRTFFTTALEPTEILTEVRVQKQSRQTGTCFLELARRRGDHAIVAVSTLMRLGPRHDVEEARIVLAGVGHTPVQAGRAESVLSGSEPTDDCIRDAARTVADEIDPVGDVQASSDYRRHLAVVLTERALRKARERSQGWTNER